MESKQQTSKKARGEPTTVDYRRAAKLLRDAAPDLLAACKAAEQAISCMNAAVCGTPHDNGEMYLCGACRARIKVRAALALAKGGAANE